MNERPIVLNSVLCLLRNYRAEPDIGRIVEQFFGVEDKRHAYFVLLELLNDADRASVHHCKFKPTLIDLFDRVIATHSQLPIFAAKDLTALPLALNFDADADRAKDLHGEMKQLRFHVQKITDLIGFWNRGPPIHRTPNRSDPPSPSATSATTSRTPPGDETAKSPNAEQRPQFDVSTLLCTDTNQWNPPSASCSSTSPVESPTSVITAAKPADEGRTKKNRLDLAVRRLTDRLGVQPQSDADDQPSGSCSGDEFPDNNNCIDSAEVKRRVSASEELEEEEEEEEEMEEEEERDDLNAATDDIANNNNTANAASAIVAKFAAQRPDLLHGAAKQFLSQNLFGQVQAMIDPFAAAQMIQQFTANIQRGYDINGAMKMDSERTLEGLSLKTDSPMKSEFCDRSSPTPSDMSGSGCDDSRDNGTEKPYTCNQSNCQKRFSNKFLLKKHQFIHTGLRPHVCPYCGKRFNRKDNLLRHKKTHLNNAVAQMAGRRRHNMLHGVSEEAAISLASFQLLQQQQQ